MDYDTTKSEAFRLLSGRTTRANTRARWENVYRLYTQGKTLEEIGRWIGRSASTACQLLKRAALERSKQPGFTWPQQNGKRICDIQHPMPAGEHASAWAHPRGYPLRPRSITRPRPAPTRAYCPVCRRSYAIAKTLVEVFAEKPGST